MTSIIGFAHRGAPSTKSDDNSLLAFKRALALGATGLETDIALTSDGVPVLTHVGLSLRPGRRVRDLKRDELPATVPSLQDLYDQCGFDFDLSLDMASPQSVEAVVRIADQSNALDRLWLTYWRMPELRAWRLRWPHVHLVFPALPFRAVAASRLIDRLAADSVDVLNVHHRFCRAWLVEYAHGKNVQVFAWGIRTAASLQRVVRHEVDGVYCDNVEEMVRLLRQVNGPIT